MLATDKRYQFDAEEWLTQNMHRNYPLADDQVVVTDTGAYLPSNFLVDMSLHTLPGTGGGNRANFYISSVLNSGGVLTVSISYRASSDVDFVCARATGISAGLRAGDSISSRTFAITAAIDSIPDAYSTMRAISGTLIIGTCQDVVSESYILDYDHARILEPCVVQSLAGMYNISFQTSAGSYITFDSDFTIQAGDGIDFELDTETNTLCIFRVATAAEKAATYTTVEQVVEAVNAELGNPIKSINGVFPDSAGNFTIAGDDCTTITAGAASVTLSNPCAKPCCSESTPADITAALQSLEDAKNRLITYFETISNNVNTLQGQLATMISSSK